MPADLQQLTPERECITHKDRWGLFSRPEKIYTAKEIQVELKRLGVTF